MNITSVLTAWPTKIFTKIHWKIIIPPHFSYGYSLPQTNLIIINIHVYISISFWNKFHTSYFRRLWLFIYFNSYLGTRIHKQYSMFLPFIAGRYFFKIFDIQLFACPSSLCTYFRLKQEWIFTTDEKICSVNDRFITISSDVRTFGGKAFCQCLMY